MANVVASGSMLPPTRRQQWGLQAYWFSFNLQGSALLTIVVPETVLKLSTKSSETTVLAQIATLVALAAMVMSPLTGAWSDREKRVKGHRFSLLWWGTAFNVAGLTGALFAPSFFWLTSSIIVAILGQTAAQSAYQALMPEVVPRPYWGRASGYMGLASLMGSIVGLGVGGFLPVGTVYVVMIASTLGGAGLTIWAVPGVQVENLGDARPKAVIRDHRVFRRVFVARFALMFGQTLLMTYVLFFFRDVLHDTHPAAGTAMVAGLAMGGAVLSSVLIGTWSDRTDRAHLVAAAGGPMAISAIGFALWPYPLTLPIWAVLYGVGYGAVLSVDWALALDSIPDLGNVARDLGIWGIASGLPPVLAPAVGGWILASSLPLALRYRLLFLVAGATFVVGSLIVLTVRQHGAPRVRWSPWLAAVVMVVLILYTRVRYRITVSGQIPHSPRSVLVVANHGHDLEGMVIPTAIARMSGLRRPVISAGSQRIFEPGFMAGRIPGPFRRYAARWNVGPIVERLGVRPIEDRPLSRPMSSWAYLIYRHFGNLRVDEVFDPASLPENLPSGARLAALWSPHYILAARREITITALTPAFRTWVRTQLRRQVEEDLGVFLDLLDQGCRLYTTPEGRLSPDGRLGRFRKSLNVMKEHAGTIAVVGVSYDILRPGRLRMWVNFAVPHWPEWLEGSVILARPITASHLVVHVWQMRPHIRREEFIQDAIGEMVQLRREGIPVAADLYKRPQAVIDEALQEFRRRLSEDSCITDPRFPYVKDFITYYQNQWDELTLVRQRLMASFQRLKGS